MLNTPDQTILNYREFLIDELARRSKRNPKYSLRAFAKALEISAPALSMILNGKRTPTPATAQKIAKKLALDPIAEDSFTRSCIKRFMQEPTAQTYNQMSLDQFALISEWYHFGILSLLDTKDFAANFQWISSRLGISLAEAKAAVERMVRLNILDTTGKKWKQVGPPILIENKISTSATRRYQKQVLEKAIQSLENDPMETRDLSSMTIAIDPKLIPVAAEEIRKFRIYLMNLLEGKGNAQEVYHLALQIYPVSKR